MSGFLSVLILRGRLSRVPYGLVAVPILLAYGLSHFVVEYAPLFFERVFGADLMTAPHYLIPFFALYALLVIPLFIVSFNRLHDIGLTGFLALPYLITAAIRQYAGWAQVHHVAISLDTQHILTYLSRGAYVYGLVLALLLLLVPGRRGGPSATQTPATAY